MGSREISLWEEVRGYQMSLEDKSTVTSLGEKAKFKQTRKTDIDGLSCVTETPSW